MVLDLSGNAAMQQDDARAAVASLERWIATQESLGMKRPAIIQALANVTGQFTVHAAAPGMVPIAICEVTQMVVGAAAERIRNPPEQPVVPIPRFPS